MKSGIYRIRNLVNNKTYIGSAIFLSNRKSRHFTSLRDNKHANTHLQNSYNIYGKDSFVFEVLHYCNSRFLINREQAFIDMLKPEYNIRLVAHSNIGIKRSEETRKKISLALKGKKRDAAFKEKMSKIAKEAGYGSFKKGHVPSEDMRAKISKALTGIKRKY